MQIGIPVAYNVCEVKPDKINHWIYVNREDFVSCYYTLKCKLKLGRVIGCAKHRTKRLYIAITMR